MTLYVKKGTAKVKHKYKPFAENPYIPEAQTPKFVIKKNNIAPSNAPPKRQLKFLVKYCESIPINKILPQVQ